MIKSEKIKIIDNFLSDVEFKSIQTLLAGPWFPWFFQDGIVNIPEKYNYQFCHTFFDNQEVNSDNFNILYPIFEKLNVNELTRVKANLRPKTKKIEYSDFHVDFKDRITSIFYINTNNGKTLFDNGTEVNSVENRMVIFDSNLIHKGTSCTDKKYRIVINFNYY